MMFWAGLAILIATVAAMIKRYDSRMLLIAGGFAMAILAGDPMAAFGGMTKNMTAAHMILNICSAMAFAFVMKYTKCDLHLGRSITKALSRVRIILVPGATLATFACHICIPSAAGVSAALGTVLIPVLIAQGVRPIMAGAAVLAGTTGDLLSPGFVHNAMVASIASKAFGREVTVMEVIAQHHVIVIVCGLVSATLIWAIAMLLKEGSGYVDEKNEFFTKEDIKVNPLYAIMPIVPVAMLVLGAMFPEQLPWLKRMRVEHCMLTGAALTLAITRRSPAETTKAFFDGMGKGYADVMGIIIAAGVFVAGLNAIGLIKVGVEVMKTSTHAAGLAAALGPFTLAVLCGSGNAATIAFNEAVTVHAAQFGMDVIDMGMLATLAGALGRSMSPVAGCTIVCAAIAKANPMELVKRTALPALAALVVAYLMFMKIVTL